MTRSDVPLCSWPNPNPNSSPAHIAGNTGLYLPRSVSTKHSGWLQNLWTDAGTCVHCTNTSPWYQPLWPATWSTKQRLINTWASISQNVIEEAVGQCRKRLRASMEAKCHHFEHLLTLNLLFSEPAHDTTGSFQSHQQSNEENTFHLFPLQPLKSK